MTIYQSGLKRVAFVVEVENQQDLFPALRFVPNTILRTPDINEVWRVAGHVWGRVVKVHPAEGRGGGTLISMYMWPSVVEITADC